MGVYIGVNNIAKKVNNIYIGVDNIARKVKSGYIGDENNIARKFIEDIPPLDPTKTEYTEAEINALAAFGLINQIPLDSKVTIGNTQDTLRTIHTYRVIGKDHQDLNITNWGSTGTVEAGTAPSIGTVDLWATGAIANRDFNSEPSRGKYDISTIRTWLNDDYYNGFSDVTKTHMKTMKVEYYWTSGEDSNGSVVRAKGNYNTNDKVKLLSAKEFNTSSFKYESGYKWYRGYMHQREGNGYEYFPSVAYNATTSDAKKRYASETGEAGNSAQWYRSLYFYKYYWGTCPLLVSSSGSIDGVGNLYNVYYYGIVPCFRLGAA